MANEERHQHHLRVTPWQEGDPAPDELVSAIRARRPDGDLYALDRVLLKSIPLAEGWHEFFRRMRNDYSLESVCYESGGEGEGERRKGRRAKNNSFFKYIFYFYFLGIS
jgi:hypothetical protein